MNFNMLVVGVVRANHRVERAAGLIIEAQTAYDDAVANLAAAEAALEREVASACGLIKRETEAAVSVTTAVEIPTATADPIHTERKHHRRCSICRQPGHRYSRCPEMNQGGNL